jgi:ubiquitin-conjugating enzyme E2 Q
MTMPLGLQYVPILASANNSIELPDGTLLDTAPDQANALADLINTIPLISSIKTHLDSGFKLKDLEASSGAITVLRWIVGSCRAYLKETKPGEGVLNATGGVRTPGVVEAGVVRQFTFVVGSPEQEDNFRQEIVKARSEKPSIEQYPTLLAFHGMSKPSSVLEMLLMDRIEYREMA